MELAANQRKEKEKVTAWGKEVNGVQIGIQLGENRVYKVGETVTLILRLRNNGKTKCRFCDEAEYFQKNLRLSRTLTTRPSHQEEVYIWVYQEEVCRTGERG